MSVIQIIEDDHALSDGITLALKEEGRSFIQSDSIAKGKDDFLEQKVDLVILDLNLPDGNGYDFLRWLKIRSGTPVLILTANDTEMDEVMGLELGADDYVSKPFSLAVLRARIAALFRRKDFGGKVLNRVYQQSPFYFDFEKKVFKREGCLIQLSPTEQKLLSMFVDNMGQILTRELLIDRLWDQQGDFVDENALSVVVNRLRKKLFSNGEVSYIRTVYGQGYCWKQEEQELL